MRKAPPPCTPASYGNLQMLPNPTAEPTVVAIAANFVAKTALSDLFCFNSELFCDNIATKLRIFTDIIRIRPYFSVKNNFQ